MEGSLIAGKPEHELSHFSNAAQSELFYTDSENDPAQIENMPGASGLAGVFSISGSHLVRLVPQFESG